MRTGQMQKLIYQALADAKAKDVAILDVRKVADFTEARRGPSRRTR